jgi:F-type H+-transporting ATPase subunit b
MFLSLDGTFFVQLVNFAIFFALLNVLFLRPVSRAIVKRRDYINSVVRDYDTYQEEAKALRAQDERLRADARREAEQVIAKSRADASNATAELAIKYAEQVQSAVESAQRQANAELDAARAGSEKLVSQLAGTMVERALAETAG